MGTIVAEGHKEQLQGCTASRASYDSYVAKLAFWAQPELLIPNQPQIPKTIQNPTPPKPKAPKPAQAQMLHAVIRLS